MKNYKNTEGYPDLPARLGATAGQAVENVAKSQYIPLVYICSPYKGDTEDNTKKARDYSRFAINNNCIPIRYISDEEVCGK